MNSKLNVIHLIAQLRYGAGRYLVDTAIEQARGLKHNVMVCVSTDADEHWRTDPKLAGELAHHGIGLHVLGDFFHRRADLLHAAAVRLHGLFKGMEGPVIAHAHTAMAGAVGHWAGADGVVITCHGWGTGRPADVDLEDALAYRLADSAITYSQHWAERMKGELFVSSPKVIPMGLNLDRFPPLPKKRTKEGHPMRIVTACELTARKGVDVLLSAMPAVWEGMPDAELHIIGNGDAAEQLRLQAASIDPGMKRVIFYGALADPYERFGEFDLFVLASRSDNLPVVLLEAMLAGLPVISTNVGGIPELIAAAGSDAIVAPDYSDELSKKIRVMLAGGKAQLLSAGKRTEAWVRARFDVKKTAIELETVYLSLLQE